MRPLKMSSKERYSVLSLASIYAFRMLGLFMILPVFAIYAQHLRGATPTLIGLALGIYGLTQACLQIPFGMLSDKFGRKRIIFIGLVLFAIGSVIAATSHSIGGIIFGRAVQGAGALGSALTALVADLTQEEHRTKAMAMIGMIIGISFAAAMVFGPLFNAWVGVTGIFWITTGLACCGMVILVMFVPTPSRSSFHSDAELNTSQLSSILRNTQLLRQDLGIFILHAILTATFIAIPIALSAVAGLSEEEQWFVYLPVLVCSFFAMVPFIIIAESKHRMKQVMIGAIITIGITQILLWSWHSSAVFIAIVLFLFFTAFIVLEASLPSLVSKIAPAGRKGTAMGVYSSSQFFGIFIGGTVGGWCFHAYGLDGVFLFCTVLAILWALVAFTMAEPRYVSTYIMNVGRTNKADAQQLQNKLSSIPGVVEAVVMYEEEVAHLKIDKTIVKPEDLQAMSISTSH